MARHMNKRPLWPSERLKAAGPLSTSLAVKAAGPPNIICCLSSLVRLGALRLLLQGR
jgi:hypothetical protein